MMPSDWIIHSIALRGKCTLHARPVVVAAAVVPTVVVTRAASGE